MTTEDFDEFAEGFITTFGEEIDMKVQFRIKKVVEKTIKFDLQNQQFVYNATLEARFINPLRPEYDGAKALIDVQGVAKPSLMDDMRFTFKFDFS